MIGFAAIDWSIVGVYMLIATIPGFFCRKYVQGQDDFLLAGRTLSVWLATATLTATEMGLITVMYMAEMGYMNGFSAMVLGVIGLVTTLFVGLTGFMVSGLRASGVTTVAEYYQQRYSRGVRILGGFIIAGAGILNYGVFLKIESHFIALITGIPDLTILSTQTGQVLINLPSINLVMSVLVVVVLLYTLLGGMVSVVLTDYVQFIVLTLGMAATTYWVLTVPQIGGFSGIVSAMHEHRGEYAINPVVTQGALGMGALWIIWQMMQWIGMNTWQTQAYRTAAVDTPKTAKTMWTLTAVNYFGRAVIPMLWGAAAVAYMSRTQTPEGFSRIAAMDGMPLMLANLPAGLVGFMMAGMLAALMSTHSSYLLAWSGVLTQDLIAPLAKTLGWEIPQSWRIWITRFFILCLGAFLILWGLWFKVKGTVWGYLGVTGTMYIAGSAPLVAFGLYWRRANTRGAYLGLLGGALPGAVYLAARITVLWAATHGFTPSPFVVRVNEFMTDPVTGILSFTLAMIGMLVGSLSVSQPPVPARSASECELLGAST